MALRVVMVQVELMNMMQTAYGIDHMPSIVRYPRGTGYGLDTLNSLFNYDLREMPEQGEAVPIGKGRIIREARAGAQTKVAILSIGTRLAKACAAANTLEEENPSIGITVADARFMKPLDIDLIRSLASEHSVLLTVEEGSIGGFGDHVLHFLAGDGALDTGKLKVRVMTIPDEFIEAAAQSEQYDEAGLNDKHIVATVKKLLDPAQVPATI